VHAILHSNWHILCCHAHIMAYLPSLVAPWCRHICAALQAKYIAERGAALSWPQAALIAALNGAGYCVFRGANSQKDRFRKDPDHPSVRHLRTLQTQRGTHLLCSGWWGVARHINYTGDWLMGLAWCLTCGHGCVVPYFYAAYFAVLLLHRERRDDHACVLKYGADWCEYKRRVLWRLIPYVY
jgi:steroid 5-alpha reductase family enzyme